MAQQNINIGVNFTSNTAGLKASTQELLNMKNQVASIQTQLNQLKLPQNMMSGFNSTFADFEKEFNKIDKLLGNGFKTKGDVTGFEKGLSQITHLFDKLQANFDGLDPGKLKQVFENIPTDGIKAANEELAKAQTNLSNFLKGTGTGDIDVIQNVKNVVAEFQKISSSKFLGKEGILGALETGDIDAVNKALADLKANFKGFKNDDKEGTRAKTWSDQFNILNAAITALNNNPGLKNFLADVQKANQGVDDAKFNALQEGINQVNTLSASGRQLKQSFEGAVPALQQTATAVYGMSESASQFASRIKYFFSATSAVRLFRKAVRQAYQTVKELDEVMTQTAVVTKFSVGDMWDQLPQYAESANKLGVSIKGVYESATLYYQQGLKTNQVMALSNSTLKMARIAGLDASEATDRMTNALRGFNMELNQTNAERVADVYSKLASLSASNVDEISTAMTKTASLASSANMSFENTAAFLSQIIETTRESADTAGTALKTVIARFAELKANPAEIVSVEGEDVEYNKVDKALQSVGISLDAFMNGSEGLDSVFMRLSERWDTLDLATQRYIATMAAGSRQQSRFIALMQDYGRMQELTGYAMDASGASTSQYEKTLDSLESKLNKLKNEWNEFTMGLANNKWIKSIVDLATSLLKILNDITDKFGETGGAIVKIAGLIATLKIGKTLATSLNQNLIIPMGAYGREAGVGAAKGFIHSFKGGIEQAKIDTKKLFGKSTPIPITEDLLKNNDQAIKSTLRADMKNLPTNQANAAGKILTTYNTEMAKANTEQEKFAAGAKAAGDYEKTFGKSIPGVTSSLQKQTASLQQMTITMAGCAMALNALVSFISNLDGVSKNMKEGLKTVSTGLTALMILLMTLPSLLSAIGAAIGSATLASGPVVIAIAAVIAGIVMLVSALNKLSKSRSYEGKIEAITEAESKFNDMLTESNEKLEELDEKLTEIENNDNVFDNLIAGSVEFNKQIATANSAVLELIDKYPQLAAYMQIGDYGQLTLDQEQANAYLENYRKQNAQANAASAMYQVAKSNLTVQKNAVLSADTTDMDQLVTKIDGVLDRYVGDETVSIGGGAYSIADTLLKFYKDNNNNANFDEKQLGAIAAQSGGTSRKIIDAVIAEVTKINTEANTSTNNEAYVSSVAELQGQFRTALSALVDTTQLADEIGTGLVDSLSVTQTANFDNVYKVEKDNLTKRYKQDADQIKQEYADAFGLTLDELAELKLEEDDLVGGLANFNIINNAKTSFDSLYAAIEGGNTSLKTLNNLVISDLATYDELYSQYQNGSLSNIDKMIEDAANKMNITPEALAKLYGFDNIDGLANYFSQKAAGLFEKANATIDKFTDTVGKKLNGTGKAINKYYERTTVAQKEAILNGITRLEKIGVTSIEDFFTAMGEVTADSVEQALAVVNSVTGTDAINDYAELKDITTNEAYTQAQKNLATSMMSASGLSSSNQLKQYLQSSEYLDKDKTIRKSMRSNKGFTASDVKELANEQENLNTMLDNGAISASNLAQTITKLKSGQITLEGLTDRVVDAVNGFKSLKSIVDDTAESISDADFGNSSAGLITTMDEYAQQLETLIKDHNAYGDTQVEEYLKFFLDETYAKSILNGEINSLGASASEQIKSIMQDIVRWTQGNGVNFWDEYAQGIVQQADALNVVKNAFGSYTATLTDNITTQELIAQVADSAKLSTEMATSEVMKFLSLSPDIKKQLDQADYNQAITNFVNKSTLDNTGALRYSTEEMKALQSFTGESEDKIKQTIAEKMNIDKSMVIKWDIENVFTSENGTTNNIDQQIDNILKQFGKNTTERKQLLVEWNVMSEDGQNIDYDAFQEKMQSLGFDDTQIAKIGEQWASDINGSLSRVVESWTYENGKATKKTEDALGESVDALDTNTQNILDRFEVETWYNTIFSAVYAGANKAIVENKDSNDSGNSSTTDTTEKVATRANPTVKDRQNQVSKTRANPTVKDRQDFSKKTYGDPTLSTLAGSTASKKTDTKKEDTNTQNKTNTGQVYKMEFSDEDKGNAITDISDKIKKIENDVSKLVNINEKIRLSQSGISIFGKAYDNLMKYGNSIYGGSSSNVSLLDLLDKRLGKLQAYNAQVDSIVEANNARSAEASKLASDFSEFFSYNAEANAVSVNYDKFQSYEKDYDTTDELGKRTYDDTKEEYDEAKKALEKVQGYASDIASSNEQLFDIQAQIEELKLEGLSTASSLIDRVADALKTLDTQRVDQIEEISNAIEKAQTKITNKMQEQINQARQERELTKTETDLDEKRRRLAYLQQDTSGGNQLEILQLQKELTDAEEDYTDTLIDNFIDKMELANQKLQEQNEQSIALQRKIIEQNEEIGAYDQAALVLMADSIDAQGNYLGADSVMYQALSKAEGWNHATSVQVTEKSNSLRQEVAESGIYLVNNWSDILENNNKTGTGLATSNGLQGVSSELGADLTKGLGDTSLGEFVGGVGYDIINANQTETENITWALSEQTRSILDSMNDILSAIDGLSGSISNYTNAINSYRSYNSDDTGYDGTNLKVEKTEATINHYYGAGTNNEWERSASATRDTSKPVYEYTGYGAGTNNEWSSGNSASKKTTYTAYTLEELKKLKFATGGIADFTGPAWLDGSPSKPELVLNATDTQTFLKFVNQLRNWNENSTPTSQNNGSSYYDIDINVEEVSDDESVQNMMSMISQQLKAHNVYNSVFSVR